MGEEEWFIARCDRSYGGGKSDGPIVLTKPLNKAGQGAAEVVEGRGPADGNADEQNAHRTQSRVRAHSALDRVRRASGRDRKAKFTTLSHHITVGRLREAFFSPQTKGSPWS